MKRLLRYVGALAVYYTGINAVYRYVRRKSRGGHVLILAYHSVRRDLAYCEMFVSPESLHAQISALKRSYRFLTVGQLVDAASTGRLAEDVAVVTFDDGYRDNLTAAADVLGELHVPFTVFLATRHIDTGQPTLFLAIALIIHSTRRDVLHLAEYGIRGLPLRTRAQREAAILSVDAIGKPLGWDDRGRLVRELAAALEVDVQDGLLDDLMLSWSDVRKLAEVGVEMGAHSVSHPVLSKLGPSSLRAEIENSVGRVSEELGKTCRVFAYPYGGPEACGAREADVCRALGLAGAVTLQETDAARDAVYLLGRMMPTQDRVNAPSGQFSAALFACETSGIMSALRLLLRRRVTH